MFRIDLTCFAHIRHIYIQNFLAWECFFVIFGWVLVRIFFDFGSPENQWFEGKIPKSILPPFSQKLPTVLQMSNINVEYLYDINWYLSHIFSMCTHQAHFVTCYFFKNTSWPKKLSPPRVPVSLECA